MVLLNPNVRGAGCKKVSLQSVIFSMSVKLALWDLGQLDIFGLLSTKSRDEPRHVEI